MRKFLDTSSVLETTDFTDCVISSVTLEELEDIKTSAKKDEEVKYRARRAVRLISKSPVEVIHYNIDDVYDDEMDEGDIECDNGEIGFSEVILPTDKEPTNDEIILMTAFEYSKNEDIIFYTEDLLMKLFAIYEYGMEVDSVRKYDEDIEQYLGYKIVTLDDENMAYMYENLSENIFNLLENEYIIIKDKDGYVVDKRVWRNGKLDDVKKLTFKSRQLGNYKPMDDVQSFAFDSIKNNDITVLYGRSGSGKTTIPLAYIMQELESGNADCCKIIFTYDTLKGQKTLGFVKGTQQEKKLSTGSLGNILNSKFGSSVEVERLLASGKLEIIATADLRGVEFSPNTIVFCTEAQNLDLYALKTLIQRCKDGCKLILDGDILDQIDTNRGVGLFRMIEVFKGDIDFGCVKLKSNYRNRLGELADKL